jgi:uncharacterized protein (DUF433 family)
MDMPDKVQNARQIVQEDAICGGDPILDGTVIRVSDVVVQAEYLNKTLEEIVSSFPVLSVQDVYAALTYYHERPTQIRQEIRSREERLNRVSAASKR